MSRVQHAVTRWRRAAAVSPGTLLPVIAEFQSDAVEIEERAPPRIARATLYLVVALIAAAVTWSSLSYVDKIVTGSGKLITTRPGIVVQSLETSVIRDIHVSAGDTVRRGQALATLDPTFSEADVDQLRLRVSALDAMIDRIETELSGGTYLASDPANTDQAVQAKLFNQRTSFYESSLHNYDAQIAGIQASLKSNEQDHALMVQRLATLRSIEEMRATLMEHQTGSRLNFLQARDARLEVEANLARLHGSRDDLSHRQDKLKADRQAFIDDFRRSALQDLVEARAKRTAAAEDLKKAELRKHMVVLTAPADATVLEVAHRSVGSVVREAETLFQLVPSDVPLEAEINVDSKDIADVAVGQAVRVKFDAYPFQKYGTGSGVVRVVSQDSFVPEGRGEGTSRQGGESAVRPGAFYRVLVELTDTDLHGVDQLKLLPGMTVSAELKAGRRSVISYFLYPLLRGLDESLRER